MYETKKYIKKNSSKNKNNLKRKTMSSLNLPPQIDQN
jgi:hypothetical protein